MNKYKTWLALALVACCVLTLSLAAETSPAIAAEPTRIDYAYTSTGTLTDVCTFPIDISANVRVTETDYVDRNGALTRIFLHIAEQDTFTANTKTLVGSPFTFNVEVLFDSSGNLTHNYASGIVEKIPLPDGSLFISAGRLDFAQHPDVMFLLSPDKGNPGNIAGFCAALAP